MSIQDKTVDVPPSVVKMFRTVPWFFSQYMKNHLVEEVFLLWSESEFVQELIQYETKPTKFGFSYEHQQSRHGRNKPIKYWLDKIETWAAASNKTYLGVLINSTRSRFIITNDLTDEEKVELILTWDVFYES